MAKILKIGDLAEFIDYLVEQIGQPYLWGGQGTLLTPTNYKTVIARHEKDASNRAKVERFCEDKFAGGVTELYGYDCSGLGTYYLQNLTHTLPHDLSANGMMGLCDIVDEQKRGYWLFRVNVDGKATHIGYMVSDTELVEARGRAYGVVRRRYVKRDWHKVGKPKCVEWDEPKPDTHEYIKVRGGSVRVREGNGTAFPSIGTAHRGDLLPCYGQADADPYWYEVDFSGKRGYISCNKRYTEVVYKA